MSPFLIHRFQNTRLRRRHKIDNAYSAQRMIQFIKLKIFIRVIIFLIRHLKTAHVSKTTPSSHTRPTVHIQFSFFFKNRMFYPGASTRTSGRRLRRDVLIDKNRRGHVSAIRPWQHTYTYTHTHHARVWSMACRGQPVYHPSHHMTMSSQNVFGGELPPKTRDEFQRAGSLADPIFSSSSFFLAIFEYNMSIGFVVSYRDGALNMISAVPSRHTNVKMYRNILSSTIATYFQSSSTCGWC